MPKRFTDSEKWVDKWFRPLSLPDKLAWNYLCDACDCAGVIELDADLANFQIGAEVDWDDLIEKSGGRIEKISTDLLWLPKFVEFQYGELKDTVKPHQAVIKRLEKRNLYARVLEGQANPLGRVHSTPKVKEKEKEKEKRGSAEGEIIELPPEVATDGLPEAVADWIAYKAERREAYKPTGHQQFVSRVTNVARQRGSPDVVEMLQRAMANGWKGWEQNGNQNGKPSRDTGQRSGNSRRGSLSV